MSARRPSGCRRTRGCARRPRAGSPLPSPPSGSSRSESDGHSPASDRWRGWRGSGVRGPGPRPGPPSTRRAEGRDRPAFPCGSPVPGRGGSALQTVRRGGGSRGRRAAGRPRRRSPASDRHRRGAATGSRPRAASRRTVPERSARASWSSTPTRRIVVRGHGTPAGAHLRTDARDIDGGRSAGMDAGGGPLKAGGDERGAHVGNRGFRGPCCGHGLPLSVAGGAWVACHLAGRGEGTFSSLFEAIDDRPPDPS